MQAMDIWDKETRSRIMSRIGQKDTKPEVIVCKFLFSKGFRYRKNVKALPGSPDIVLRKYKAAIFVHGCFWHGHTCRAGKRPTSNTSYWNEKIASNITRDAINESILKELRWNVIVVWQCELKNQTSAHTRLESLVGQIKQSGE